MKYAVVEKLRCQYPVSLLCWYLGCSRSGFYDWLRRGKPCHNKLDDKKCALILEGYQARPSRGRRQIQMWLERQHGLHMSLGSIHRYMSILGLSSIRKNKPHSSKKETRGQAHTFPNVLQQDFRVSPGQQNEWLTDITYLPAKDGILYLSCIKDLSDNSIVAYQLSNKNDLELVMDTLHKAIESPKMRPGTILHSDQGSPYCSRLYHLFLEQHGFVGSMSNKGTPLDNAPMESFFSTLKNEELVLHPGISVSAIAKVVPNFIHFYNHLRPQYGLKKLTPAEFGSQFQ